MKRTITGLIFGNNRKQCHTEMLTQVMAFTDTVEVLYFRKVKGKDLFEYSVIIILN